MNHRQNHGEAEPAVRVTGSRQSATSPTAGCVKCNIPKMERDSFLGTKGSLCTTALGLALKHAASACCFNSSFIYDRSKENLFINWGRGGGGE